MKTSWRKAMKTIIFNRVSESYKTLEECRAFSNGVELVNDSALEIRGIRNKGRYFEVLMYDKDLARISPDQKYIPA